MLGFKRSAQTGTRAQCARCGMVAKADKIGHRKRYKIDAFAWSSRCKALRADPRLRSPFDCPDMRAAVQGLTPQHGADET